MSDEPDGILPAAREQSLTEEEIQHALVAFAQARRSRNERFVLAASSISLGGVAFSAASPPSMPKRSRGE
jgi:hypothetical protein